MRELVTSDGSSVAAPPAALQPLPRQQHFPVSRSSGSISQLDLDTPMAHGDPAALAPAGMLAPDPEAPAAPATDGGPDAGSARGEGSVHQRSITLHADGSAHGGRRFFGAVGGAAAPPQQAQQAPGSYQRRDHQAVWIVEDSSRRSGSAGLQREGSAKSGTAGSLPPQPPRPPTPCKCCGCACGGGGSGGSNGGQGGSFGNAKVLIEEADERQLFEWGTFFTSLPKKMKGGLDTRLPVPTARDIFWSWLGAFLGILAVCALNQWASPEIDIAFLVGSFGASAVLVFGVLESKLSQPRNFIGGQVLSAVVGVTTRVIIHQPWIAGPVGMSLALVLMQLTSTVHPPGGATALIAATMTTLPKWHGYSYLITVLVGSVVMLSIALVVNNLDPRRRWPTCWW